MAYVKKNAETENVETTDEVVAEQKVKTSASPVDQSDEIAALKAQIEMLTKMMAAGLGAQAPAPAQSSSLLEEVKVVHLRECLPGTTTHIHLSNRDLDFASFGATLTLDRRQAEELAGGTTKKFFDRGVIAFGEGSEELAKTLGVKSIRDYEFMGSDFVKRLGTMNVYELEDIYNKLIEYKIGRTIVKCRYRIPIGKYVAEVDKYLEDLEGLLVVEVEFNSLEDANNFEVPNWFGKEITEDLRYKNDNLAIATKEEVGELLKDTGVIHLNNHFSHTNLSVK